MTARQRLRMKLIAERLEDRCMLAAEPFISEFMARNGTTLLDGDGNSSDWIEIGNRGDEIADLAGWYLTDDDDRPTRWRFPDTRLAPGEFMVMFASGQDTDDYVDANGNLHTNFRLDGDGEYLALIAPDGQTVVSDFTPRFPDQRSDVSYGIDVDAAVSTRLIDVDSGARVVVPSQAVGPWTEVGFDDSDWSRASASIGFDRSDEPEIPRGLVTHLAFNETNPSSTTFETVSRGDESIVGAAEFVEGRFGQALDFDGTTFIDLESQPDHLRDGFTLAAWIQPDEGNRTIISALTTDLRGGFWFGYNNGGPWLGIAAGASNQPGATGQWHNVNARDTISLGDWHHVAVTFDPTDTKEEVKIYVDGMRLTSGVSGADLPNGQMGDAIDVDFRFGLHNDGRFPFDGRMDEVAVFNVPLSPVEVEALSQNPVLSDISFASEIKTDLEASMFDFNATALLRVPFEVQDLHEFDILTLRLKYDDGFVSYLNGVPVASDNSPSHPEWSSSASEGRHDRLAGTFVDFNISEHIPALKAGKNVLAIQGLNVNRDDGDFLLAAELVAQQTDTVVRFFPNPTPGSPNHEGVDGFVDELSVSTGRGFYDEPIDVVLDSETEDAVIRYTSDGSAPSASNGIIYTDPIRIDSTTTLRAAAFKEGFAPSATNTQTYLYLDEVIRQSSEPPGVPNSWGTYKIGRAGRPVPADYEMNQTHIERHADTIIDDLKSLPTMSIVMDPEDLFGGDDGIYIDAFQSDETRERATSIEWIESGGGRELQIDAGIRLFGGWSRHFWATPKKSFALKFKRPYGPTSLEFPLFRENQVDSTVEPTEEFDTVLLRAVFSDAWPDGASAPQYLRDLNARYSQLAMGQPSSHGTWVHLYLNGLYWGIYNPSERPDASFMASYFGGDKDEYDAVKHTGLCGPGCATNDSFEVIDGGEDARQGFQEALTLARRDLRDPGNYQRFKELVDVENLADYIILQHYIGNVDWPHKNWYASRQREGGQGWQFFVWDSEYTLRATSDTRVTRSGPANANTPAALFHGARRNQEFQDLFADRVQKHLLNDGALRPEANIDRYTALANQIEGAIKLEAARWGDNGDTRQGATNYSFANWQSTRNSILRNYFPRRHDIAIRQLQSAGLFPDVEAPVFSRFGGEVDAGFQLEIGAPQGNIYFTLDGSDPRDSQRNPSGVWYTSPITLIDSAIVKARAFHNGEWSALTETTFEIAGGDGVIILQNGTSPDDNYAGTADTQLRENTPAASLGEATTVVVSADDPEDSHDRSSALLSWDLSNVPAGAVVEAAALTLHLPQSTSDRYELFAVHRDWSESEATWIGPNAGESWQVAGAGGREDRGLPRIATSLVRSESPARFFVPTGNVAGWNTTDFDDADWNSVSATVGYEIAGDPLVPGVRAAWRFDEGGPAASTVEYVSGSNDEIVGTATFDEGQFGNAIEMDGSTYVRTLQPPNNLRDGFTIAVWIKPSASNRTIVSQVNDGLPNRGLWFGYNQGGPWLGMGAGALPQDDSIGKWANVSAPEVMDRLDQWYHVAATFDPGDASEEVKFFVNGQRLTSGVEGANLPDGWMGDPNGLDFLIGRHNSGAFPFEGLMDELVILDRQANVDQIQRLMDDPQNALTGSPLSAWIRSDVGPALANVNSTAYLRIPFRVVDPNEFDRLRLQLRYDDGFVAYLNGVELARRNVNDPISWNSDALESRESADALQVESIDVSAALEQLRAGANVLAIQGINASRDDNDFLIQAELIGIAEANSLIGTLGPGVGHVTTELNATGVQLVQSWIADASSNHGIAIAAADTSREDLVFDSSESDVAANRPRLLIRLRNQESRGDFNQDGSIDATDIRLLCDQIRTGQYIAAFDLVRNGAIGGEDRDELVFGILRSTYGDANLDRNFDSSDLVHVFQAGQYEDDLIGNSDWTEGDWNCDGDFDTSDLVLAFRTGGYLAAARPASQVVDAVFRLGDNVDVAEAFATDRPPLGMNKALTSLRRSVVTIAPLDRATILDEIQVSETLFTGPLRNRADAMDSGDSSEPVGQFFRDVRV